MTREEYLNAKNTGQIPIELLYEYYDLFRGDKPAYSNLGEFMQHFQIFSQVSNIDFGGVSQYFDNKFKINKLSGKEGNVICFL